MFLCFQLRENHPTVCTNRDTRDAMLFCKFWNFSSRYIVTIIVIRLEKGCRFGNEGTLFSDNYIKTRNRRT